MEKLNKLPFINGKMRIMRNKLFISLYLVFIILIALYALKKPEYNWDMLAYMSVVVGYDHSDVTFVHDTVYNIAKQQLPASTYSQLTDAGIPYRKRMAENADQFHQQMPFYTVKPLYTGLVYLFYKAGFPLIRASLLPSFLGYVLTGWLLIFWIKRYMQFFLALAIGIFMMLTPTMWGIARLSTPDCVSTFLLLGAVYFILERRSLLFAFIFLLLSIFARVDNAVPAFFILSLLAFTNKWEPKISVKKYLLMLLFVALSYLCITLSTRGYGWDMFYYASLVKSSNLSHAVHQEFHLKDYIALSISQIMTGLFYSNLFLFITLALLLFIGRPPFQFRNLSIDQLFVGVIIVSIVVRFILQPIVSDRYYAAYYICILILLIRSLSRRTNIPPVA